MRVSLGWTRLGGVVRLDEVEDIVGVNSAVFSSVSRTFLAQ